MEYEVRLRAGDRASLSDSRFLFCGGFAHVAQSVEHVLGKDEVTSSILVVGSIEEIIAKMGSK